MNIERDETKKHPKDVFDNNFEVIYEGDLPELPNDLGSDDYKDVLSNLSELDTTSSMEIDYLEQNKTRTLSNMLNPSSNSRYLSNRSRSQKGQNGINLGLQITTLLLTAAIAGFLAVNFWNHKATYTHTVISDHNYILGAYYGISFFLLLIEWITFLNILLNSDALKGRGLFSFLLIYFGSLLSNQFANLIPSFPVLLQGVREALTVYGSLNRTLFLLCCAGVVICIIRKIYNTHKI